MAKKAQLQSWLVALIIIIIAVILILAWVFGFITKGGEAIAGLWKFRP